MTRPVAVVTIAHGRHDHLRRQVRSLAGAGIDHVVVAMGDPAVGCTARRYGEVHVVHLDADPAALPLAAARNRGAQEAIDRGATTIVFLDVDCIAGPGLADAYDQVVSSLTGTLWSGPVTYLPSGLTDEQLARPWTYDDPHPGRPAPAPGEVVAGADPDLFWSLSFALHRDAWEKTGGFCEDYVGYGGEDTDFARVARDRGLGHGWVGSARAYHQHHPTQDPPVQHVHDIVRNAALFHDRWGEWPMLGWLQAFEELGLVERDADGFRVAARRLPTP